MCELSREDIHPVILQALHWLLHYTSPFLSFFLLLLNTKFQLSASVSCLVRLLSISLGSFDLTLHPDNSDPNPTPDPVIPRVNTHTHARTHARARVHTHTHTHTHTRTASSTCPIDSALHPQCIHNTKANNGLNTQNVAYIMTTNGGPCNL